MPRRSVHRSKERAPEDPVGQLVGRLVQRTDDPYRVGLPGLGESKDGYERVVDPAGRSGGSA